MTKPGKTPGPAAPAETPVSAPPPQPGNPLPGITLEGMVTALSAHYGWQGLGERIAIRCFTHDPGVASSLKFLRRTPWAREKVESLYLYMQREIRRAQPPAHNFPPPGRNTGNLPAPADPAA